MKFVIFYEVVVGRKSFHPLLSMFRELTAQKIPIFAPKSDSYGHNVWLQTTLRILRDSISDFTSLNTIYLPF